MKEIELTQGQVALVDDEDYEELSKYKWYAWKGGNTYYAARNLSKKNKYNRMHRMILGVTDGKTDIDHIDGNGLNNQKNNLRTCFRKENIRNQRKQNRKIYSIYKGICYRKNKRKWEVYIVVDGESIYLGLYEDEYTASVVYDLAAIKYFKEFAKLNHSIENYIGKDLDSYFTKRIPTSKYRGVCWHKQNNKWQSAIRIKGKSIYLGIYSDEIEAAKAYDDAAMKYYGSDYPRFNFP